MNIRWNIILSLIVLALSAWFYSLNQATSENSQFIKAVDSPEYTGHKMQTTVFSPTGKKQYVASSDVIEHYAHNGETHFLMPELYLYQLEQDAPLQSWKVRADKAVLNKNNMLYLDGNVQIESLLESRKLQKIETESVVINLKNQDISSENKVNIRGSNFHSTGLKLSGNLHQQVATLKEQVKTYYEIKN